MSTRNYSPGDINAVVNGTVIQGFAKGTFIKATRNEDQFKLIVGSVGNGARTQNLNQSGKITFSVLQTEPENDFFSALQTGQVIEIDINDNNSGSTLVRSTEAWLMKPTDVDFADEAGNCDYVFECTKLEIFRGGSLT